MPSNRWMRLGRLGAALVLLLMALPGCAPFKGGPEAPLLSDAQQSLYALKTWKVEGRIGVQAAQDAWQADLYWEHEPAQDRLRLSGPLSQGMVSIVLQKGLIYINEGQGVSRLSHDPDALLRERLGFTVPLPSLRYWMLGVPDPGQEYTLLPGEGGAPPGFRQAGWAVRMDHYANVGNVVLPQKLGIQGDKVRLKIIADHWEIGG
jgi:outer membrane lipoprotein LolB